MSHKDVTDEFQKRKAVLTYRMVSYFYWRFEIVFFILVHPHVPIPGLRIHSFPSHCPYFHIRIGLTVNLCDDCVVQLFAQLHFGFYF